jgi:hypothetical protein
MKIFEIRFNLNLKFDSKNITMDSIYILRKQNKPCYHIVSNFLGTGLT